MKDFLHIYGRRSGIFDMYTSILIPKVLLEMLKNVKMNSPEYFCGI